MSKWRFSDYENKDGSYKVDDNKHPINLWHTPRPFNEGDDTRATRWNSWLMKFFFWLNISASLTFIAALLCPLVTTPHV
ncbi:MAG: hypothetical protein SCARUB_02807 [Candidatus Scalindua rubra]|uniref:Uncharacterized protein n=1 Tax=Candidatus Scalindua rubra TaxID=1872076 RepID=A0A1E3XAQ9_9BACT|nr:MAG: hypothetical protein SCARUB_02807 [Candidatus Scalindua rubra]